jgi:hypothetical protein
VDGAPDIVPDAVPLRHAIASGMRTMEHCLGLNHAVFADRSLANPDLWLFQPKLVPLLERFGRGELKLEDVVDEAAIDEIARLAATHAVWFVATHYAMRNFTSRPATPKPDEDRFLSPGTRAIWRLFAALPVPEAVLRGEDQRYQLRSRCLLAIHRAGGRVMVGTDAPVTHVYVGASVVDEMETLVEVGFTRAEVLRAATTEPARYLGVEGERGEVKEGAVADLLLLDGDPLADLSALRRPGGVMLRGQWRTREALDRLLDGIATRFAAEESAFADLPGAATGHGRHADFVGAGGAALRASSTPGESSPSVQVWRKAAAGADWQQSLLEVTADGVADSEALQALANTPAEAAIAAVLAARVASDIPDGVPGRARPDYVVESRFGARRLRLVGGSHEVIDGPHGYVGTTRWQASLDDGRRFECWVGLGRPGELSMTGANAGMPLRYASADAPQWRRIR